MHDVILLLRFWHVAPSFQMLNSFLQFQLCFSFYQFKRRSLFTIVYTLLMLGQQNYHSYFAVRLCTKTKKIQNLLCKYICMPGFLVSWHHFWIAFIFLCRFFVTFLLNSKVHPFVFVHNLRWKKRWLSVYLSQFSWDRKQYFCWGNSEREREGKKTMK